MYYIHEVNAMLSNKIKALLALKNRKSGEYSKALGLKHPNALTTKYMRESFKPRDLIILGEVTGTHLAFVDENDKPVIIFDRSDLPEENHN